MPRTPIITPETVARAATELLAQGRPVTNAAVLDLVGGGSMSTLVPLLRAWREGQKDQVAREEIEVPGPVMEQVRELAARIWRDATEEAQTATDALRRELRDLRQETEQQHGELIAHLGTLEAERDAAMEQRDQLSTRVDELEADKLLSTSEQAKAAAAMEALREKCEFLEATLAKAEGRADRAEARLLEILKDMNVGKSSAKSVRSGKAMPGEAGAAG
jgi:chromosome segregation ATPase